MFIIVQALKIPSSPVGVQSVHITTWIKYPNIIIVIIIITVIVVLGKVDCAYFSHTLVKKKVMSYKLYYSNDSIGRPNDSKLLGISYEL